MKRALFALAAALLSSPFVNPCSAVENTTKPFLWPQDASDISADPAVTYGVLPNGVRYAVMKNAEPPGRVSLRLYVRAGSLMEGDGERGTAHYIEHMGFNSNRHHSGSEIVEYFQRLGMGFGNDLNAQTTFDRTVYQLELPQSDDAMLAEALQALRDYADGNLFAAADVDKERGIILAEKQSRDSVIYRQMVDSLEFSLPDSIVPHRMPIGETDVISAMTTEKLRTFYTRWYTPDRLIVLVVGDVDSTKAAEYVKRYFGDIPLNAAPQPDPDLGVIKPRGTTIHVAHDNEAPGVSISIDNVRQLRTGADSIAERRAKLALDVADAIVTRRLQKLQQKPGAVFANGSCVNFRMLRFIDDTGVSLSCNPQNWSEALTVAEQELRRALEHGFTSDELKEAVANERNQYEQAARQASTRKSADLVNRMVANFADGTVFSTPDTDLAIAASALDALTPESALAAFRAAWQDGTRIVIISGNLPQDVTDATAQAVFEKSAKAPVAEMEVKRSSAFAYTEFGQPGTVVWSNDVKDLGIAQIRFANNVHLNIKRATVEKDAVNLRIQFGTGALETPKDKPGLGVLASLAFANGGLKAHSADEIKALFAGRNVGTYFQAQPDYFMFGARTNPRDLEAQLEVFAAYMIAPGFREDGMAAAHTQIQQMYAFLPHTPQGVLMNDVNRFLAGGDYRFALPPEEQMLSLTMADMRAWMEPQLASARVEISIYGDVDMEKVEGMVARTFGALPVRDEAFPDLDSTRTVQMPAPQEISIEYTTELPKGVAVVAWHTDDPWDIVRAQRLNLLGVIVQDRMRIKLREKMGNAYTPFANYAPNEAYRHMGYLMCICEVAPERVLDAAAEIRRIVGDIATHGVTKDELKRAKQPFLGFVVQKQRDGDYWTGFIMGSCQAFPARLDWARQFQTAVDATTVDDINRLAAQYLDADKAIEIRILPNTLLKKSAKAAG